MSWFIAIATFFFMEFVAWAAHKYVMHGFLWDWHVDHHLPHKSFFEKNDRFFLVFAVPSALSFILGSVYTSPEVFAIGIGIAVYGFAYFLVHDVFIHQRFKWFKRTDSVYLRAIRKAHKVHHKHLTKEDGECFGMLWVPLKYFKESLKSKKLSKA